MAVTELTPQEVIIELDRCKHDGHIPVDWGRRRAAIDAAKQAVEKSKNALPTKKCGVLLDGVTLCPTCGHTVVDKPCYCKNCGQALDWGGE